jgi:excisionase family DNA binding protein
MAINMDGYGELLQPAQVARIFAVDPKTVTRWAQKGWISSIKTPGGHRRYPQSEVEALMARFRTVRGE